MRFKVTAFVFAFVLICIPVDAASISLPLTIQGTFTSFNILNPMTGTTVPTGSWTVTGAGNWLLDTSTGVDTSVLNLTARFPTLGTEIIATFAENGIFEFALDTVTNQVGILSANQGSIGPLSGAIFDIISYWIPRRPTEPPPTAGFPPFPTTPPSPLILPPLPPGFISLPPGALPQLSELENTNAFLVSGIVSGPGIAGSESFQGTGTEAIVPEASTLCFFVIGVSGLIACGRPRVSDP
jgi:hypothetical protein